MKDIVSNALMLGLGYPEPRVAAFLDNAEVDYTTGQELLEAAAPHFELSASALSAEVANFKHCNCSHDRAPGGSAPAPSVDALQFAKDVALHVVLHNFKEGSGGASWSRSKRTTTVHSEYLQRFIEQGQRAE